MAPNKTIGAKKLLKSKSGLKIVPINNKEFNPFTLDEPPWVPDKEVSHCSTCSVKFNFTKRKHHCRRCGMIFCGDCCCRRMHLPRMCFVDPVRVCEPCAETCGVEADFFSDTLKLLENGGTFLLIAGIDASTSNLCLCSLSCTYQHLMFDSSVNLPPLSVESISSYSLSYDNESGASVEIIYDNKRLRLTTGPENHRANGVAWLQSLDRAFRMINIPSRSL